MSKNSLRVLFSSVGRRVELIQCFRADAQALGLQLTVIGTDANASMSAGCRASDHFATVPRCKEAGFVPALLDLCRQHSVDLLIPTIDTELEVLSKHRQEFGQIGTLVAVSNPEVVAICRDKMQTASVLARHGVTVPRTVSLSEIRANPGSLSFPVILKPVDGSSSVGIQRFKTADDLLAARLPEFTYMVQELWEGPEYTVNLFFDTAHELRSVVPHRRYETRAGEVSKGITENVPVLLDHAQKIARALPSPFGALCFQAILRSPGEAAVFEINARFGGGYPLAWRAGATFSKWLLEIAAGLPSTTHPDWEEGLTMLRYDAAIFISK